MNSNSKCWILVNRGSVLDTINHLNTAAVNDVSKQFDHLKMLGN